MQFIRLTILLLLTSCATKYILPGNRFLSPETQGNVFESQFEFQQARATQASLNATNIHQELDYFDVTKSSYLFSSSLLDSLDFFWSHTGSANSLLGLKYQLLGASRVAKGSGHKLAVSLAFGGNEHEIEEAEKVHFYLRGQDYSLIYGYRFNEYLLFYSSAAYSSYQFDAEIMASDPSLNGQKPSFSTSMLGGFIGTELSYSAFFGKVELGYQEIRSARTKVRQATVVGYSLGFSW
jgi:hypothetical protein